jgi:hypothetical protein
MVLLQPKGVKVVINQNPVILKESYQFLAAVPAMKQGWAKKRDKEHLESPAVH